MASPAKELMDLFNDLRTTCIDQDDFEGVLVYDACENMVNNLMHGVPFAEIYPRLRTIYLENSEASFTTANGKDHYLTAIMWMDLFATDKGLTVPE